MKSLIDYFLNAEYAKVERPGVGLQKSASNAQSPGSAIAVAIIKLRIRKGKIRDKQGISVKLILYTTHS